ncbi:MAG: flagellar hook-length control protein FliK [Gammaproteobacteria bacterium]|nr:flagellar hook-length control protein FliK [Gammaproteobacteria bacterium]
MSGFPSSNLHFPGFPSGLLAQTEAPFGGSLEEAVARLRDGSLPSDEVEALRDMFASLLATADPGAGSRAANSPALSAVTFGSDIEPVPGGMSAEVPGGMSAEVPGALPADVLAALGLPVAGQSLPDALPASADAVSQATAQTMPQLLSQPVPGTTVAPMDGSETAPDALLAATVDPVANDADVSAGSGSPAAADGRAATAERSMLPAAAWLDGESAAAADVHLSARTTTDSAATGMEPGAVREAQAAGEVAALPGSTTRGVADGAIDVAAAPVAGASQGTGTAPAVAASEAPPASAAVQRLAALLAGMEDAQAAGEDAAADDAWLREAMPRIDTALQAVRGGGETMALRAGQEASASPSAGLEALAARLLAAGDDAGKRQAALQEFRQQLAVGNEVAPAAPTAPNPSAMPAAGAERAPPSLPLSLPLQHERWGEEVGERVRWMIGQQMQTAELKITPAHLGTIEVRISMRKDQMQISFASPHAAVREVLEDAAPRLREMMSAAGYAGVDVDVSHHQPSRHNEGGSRQWAGAAAWGDDESEVQQSTGTITPRASGALDCYA